MAHMIDVTTGKAAIAFVGQTPWHGLGQKLTQGADIDTWTREAGLEYTVLESPVQYETEAGSNTWSERKVLYRSDIGTPLAVVSKGYNVVQPSEVMDFFRKLTDIGGFQLETAGVLSEGRRVWALAKVGDSAEIVDRDLAAPYLLLGTSYDGTMATVAKFTAIRVVCNNTIVASVGGYGIKGEKEKDNGFLKSSIRVVHSEQFRADDVRLQLGIVKDAWKSFLVQTRQLAKVSMSQHQADEFVKALLQPYHKQEKAIQEVKGYKQIMEMFKGRAIGSDIPGVTGTRWGMLNAVTEVIDHKRGRSNNTRLESAWFGTGAALKVRAVELLTA